ncbi:hypothetical protein A5893_16290 [Pedobacter psychrophilus]|uniref:Uncharacterized protein n=1 Tax=Pedobacter psychrophilus TaxID=1826909 RepID=A0A179DB49_9SPHI|nr:hypothetical protein A5893_16290 [Pedobacter psychrophilus]
MFLSYLAFAINFIAVLSGFLRIKIIKNRGLKFFPVFLLIQFLNILFTSKIFHFGNNLWVYNIFMVFDTICISFLFYQLLEKVNFKRTVIYMTILFIIFYFINRFFIQNNGEYLSYSRSLMGFNLVVFSLLYFYNLFDFTKPEENLIHKADFWIVIGIFFFYLTSTVLLSALNYMVELKSELLKYYKTDTIKFLAMGLYSFYIVGYLCHKPQQQEN